MDSDQLAFPDEDLLRQKLTEQEILLMRRGELGLRDQDDPETLKCPRCGSEMVVRTNCKTQEKFLGCKSYPRCKFTQPRKPIERSGYLFYGICKHCWAPLKRIYYKNETGVIRLKCTNSECNKDGPRRSLGFILREGDNSRTKCPCCDNDLEVKHLEGQGGTKVPVYVCKNLGGKRNNSGDGICTFMVWPPDSALGGGYGYNLFYEKPLTSSVKKS